jgi:GTP-binding protein Era
MAIVLIKKLSYKSGFVNIIGNPNVGKSTLMNKLVGENVSIITSKAQTTRHRILGILNGEDFQIVYSDTPGILKPQYELHKSMMRSVNLSVEDADVLLLIVEASENVDHALIDPILRKTEGKILLLLNKIDLIKDPNEIDEKISNWKSYRDFEAVIPISALEGTNLDLVFQEILKYLPVHPPYYPKDQLTDKPERFLAAEMIRGKIFQNYKQEVPYSTEVVITDFKEDETIIRMRAEIYVERNSQKGIIIGKGGTSLKKIGIEARKDLEKFFGKQVFLEQYVKVEKDWRRKKNKLNQFGY